MKARLLPYLALVVCGCIFFDVLPVNGDAAVYGHQVSEGDLWSRPTHAGYIACLLAAARLFGADPVATANGFNLVACVVLVHWIGVGAHRPTRTRWFATAAMLPYATFGEVDVLWMALVAAALFSDRTAWRVVGIASAVSVSPLALLALPYGMRKYGVRFALPAACVVVLLTGITQGAWWFGDRGVLAGTLDASVRVDWLVRRWPLWCVVAVAWRKDMLLLLPLLLGPSDQPSALLALLVALRSLRVHMPLRCIGALAMGFGVLGLGERSVQVRMERGVVAQLRQGLDARGSLVGPWSMSVRASVASTGDPYALMWRPHRGFVRDQKHRWCNHRHAVVLLLKPSRDMGPWGPRSYSVTREAGWRHGCDEDR